MVTVQDLKLLPDKPGVYLMRDGSGKLIYVGKAISLRNRVRSYFQAGRNLGARIESMVKQVDRVEFITTASEVEALVLECNLIKKEHPKYNVRLRDDKQYPWVKISMNERFPQVYITRKLRADGAKYYGPYTDVGALRATFKLLRQLFPLRNCKWDLDHEKVARPCLNFHIQRCLAPCSGGISAEAYRELIDQVHLFLQGHQEALLVDLKTEMATAASQLEYELAARLRDRIAALEKVLEKQKIVSDSQDESDIFGLAQDDHGSMIQVFQVRTGKLVGREYFLVTSGNETSPQEVIESFLTQYYDNAAYIPRSVFLPVSLESEAAMKEWLASQRGAAVRIKLPKQGTKLELIRMAAENARNLLVQERSREQQRFNYITEILSELQQELLLDKLPLRIEGFDISNLQGQEAVASMVVFENGVPKGSDYRRFKIRTVVGPNDFAMLQEAVRRRFRKGLEERQNLATEKGKFALFPDLLLIDGGKGQLSAVQEVMDELGLAITTIGLAKQEEEIFLTGWEEPLQLSRRSEALKLLQRVRDEAHRFAVTYHKTLRDKQITASGLDGIKGIGQQKKKLLIKQFGSVRGIRAATVEELAKVPGITRKLAEQIKEEL